MSKYREHIHMEIMIEKLRPLFFIDINESYRTTHNMEYSTYSHNQLRRGAKMDNDEIKNPYSKGANNMHIHIEPRISEGHQYCKIRENRNKVP